MAMQLYNVKTVNTVAYLSERDVQKVWAKVQKQFLIFKKRMLIH